MQVIDNSKVFAVRIPARGVTVLEKAIDDSGLSQSAFFRIALEALINDADISAASFRNGEQAGLARAGELLRGGVIANLTALADRLEKKADSASGVESVELTIDEEGGDDGG